MPAKIHLAYSGYIPSPRFTTKSSNGVKKERKTEIQYIETLRGSPSSKVNIKVLKSQML